MTEYNKWTKEDLIKRVKQLEHQLRTGPHDEPSTPEHSSPEPIVPESSLPETVAPSKIQNVDAEANTLARQPKKPKVKRIMDSSKYSTRFIALKLAYIGKNYNGFEYQCTGVLSSIEEELWKALVKACLIQPNPEKPNEVDWNVCGYSKCGRTDRGVSAFGQVVALTVRSNKLAKSKDAAPAAGGGGEETTAADLPLQNGKDAAMAEATEAGEEADDVDDDTPIPVEQEIQYCRVLNRVLPADIRVYGWCPTPPPGFSARFSCRERQYRYFFTQPAFAPLPNFLEPPSKATRAKTKDGWLDIEAMREAAKSFEGLHDFRNYCKIDPSKQITNFHRRIFEADIVEVDGVDSEIPFLSHPQFRDSKVSTTDTSSPKVYYFHVRGSAFLWHQIRCMIAVLFLVGQGHEPPSVIAKLLDAEANPRRPNYILADDAPLVLWECLFGRGQEDGTPDEVEWLYLGSHGDSPHNLHGSTGLAGDLWSSWREKKIDEILANRMLDWLSRKTSMEKEIPAEFLEKAGRKKGSSVTKSTWVFQGGNKGKLSGAWVPMMKKSRMQGFEEMNDKYAVRKGFKNAEEMRALGNWRDKIREAKEKGMSVNVDAAGD